VGAGAKVASFICTERARTDEKFVQAELLTERDKDEYLKQLLLQFFRGDDRPSRTNDANNPRVLGPE
jgi:hypothetical protein